MTVPSIPLARELVGTACCAPSVHNTQPWTWQILDATTMEAAIAFASAKVISWTAVEPASRMW